MTLTEELTARGLIEHVSGDAEKILNTKRTVYLGLDPTADSLQIGNLAVILLMYRLAAAGHRLIFLMGGGTGMIGDPRDKGERSLMTPAQVASNVRAIRQQLKRMLGTLPFRMVDNADWLMKLKLVPFLRDVGKHFTINDLIKRDTIRKRLETPDESISYTEFAYALLQGYDYLMLNQKHGCDLQIGGSDQWTNLLSGVDLIRKTSGKESFALTIPLITDASGKKFGKSEGNAIWLDPKKTTPFAFYQFWYNLPDEDIARYLKVYTFMELSEIEQVMQEHNANPGKRLAQTALAQAVTEIVHGKTNAAQMGAVSGALFGAASLSELSASSRDALIKEVPTLPILRKDIVSGLSVLDVLATSTLVSSKSDARRLIEAKGITLNGSVIEDGARTLAEADFANGLALLRKGKREVSMLVLK